MFWKKKVIVEEKIDVEEKVEEVLTVTEADVFIDEVRNAYMVGDANKELSIQYSLYKDLFKLELIDNVDKEGDQITCTFNYYRGQRVRLKIKT